MKTSILIGTLLCLLSSFSTNAETITLPMFIDNMAARHGFAKTELSQLFAQTKVRNSILDLMNRPVGKKGTPWYRYMPKFVTERRINEGTEFWQENARTLARAETTYGVPAAIIVAIIGVETIYGTQMGNVPVIDALTTLAFHYPRRADFFRDELENFLLLTREERMNPLLPKGSYAGAMGIGQFMPSSYRQYAVDFDGDGKRDIWTNVADAIGSVANYFKKYGWQTGQPVMLATQVRPETITNLLTDELNLSLSLQQLKQQGLIFSGNQPDNSLGMLLELETEQGTAYWVGLQNFYVITRYNHSKNYAMAVYQLAKEIANNYYASSSFN